MKECVEEEEANDDQSYWRESYPGEWEEERLAHERATEEMYGPSPFTLQAYERYHGFKTVFSIKGLMYRDYMDKQVDIEYMDLMGDWKYLTTLVHDTNGNVDMTTVNNPIFARPFELNLRMMDATTRQEVDAGNFSCTPTYEKL